MRMYVHTQPHEHRNCIHDIRACTQVRLDASAHAGDHKVRERLELCSSSVIHAKCKSHLKLNADSFVGLRVFRTTLT